MLRKILITETERQDILKMYGLLKEEDNNSGFTVDKVITFGPGYYSLGPKTITTPNGVNYSWDVKGTLDPGLNEIKNFLTKNPTGYMVSIQLYSGESQIPNKDNEQGGTVVDVGYLSDKRLETLTNYLNPILESWKSEGIIKTDYKITSDKKLGQTAWVGSFFCKQGEDPRKICYPKYAEGIKAKDQKFLDIKAKYDSEQYFRVIMSVTKVEQTGGGGGKPKNECDLTELTIQVSVAEHDCNNAEFFLLANNVILYNTEGGYTANGNNSSTSLDFGTYTIGPMRLNPGYGLLHTKRYGTNGALGGKRSDLFYVKSDQVDAISKSAADGFIHIWYICVLEDGGCHLDMPSVTIKKGNTVIAKDVKPESNSALLVSIDKCGNKIVLPETLPSEPNVSVWRKKYVSDRTGFTIENELEGEVDGKQKLLKGVNILNQLWNQFKAKLTGGILTYEYTTLPKPKNTQADYDKDFIQRNKTLYDTIKFYDDNSDEVEAFFSTFWNKVKEYDYTATKTRDGGTKFTNKLFRQDKNNMFQDVKKNLTELYDDMGNAFTFDFTPDAYTWNWVNDIIPVAKNLTKAKYIQNK